MQTDISALLPSRNFQPRIYGVGAWTSHLHFACDLVAEMKPRVLVELGVDRGESYFAFCQAAAENKTGTRCFGIDTWQGDQHSGGYDETTFDEVSTHNAAHYASFSTLRRSTFAEALTEFAAATIDLLHLDGLHTEDAVRADVAAWLPKLRPGGILLLHDVGVRSSDFGVWKVWEELRLRGRSWTFEDGPGLGVWENPPSLHLPAFLESLLNAPNEQSAALAEYYRRRAAEMQERIAQEWRDGSIRHSPFARQTVIQVFYTADGEHRAEDFVSTRIGHNTWKDVAILLPPGARAKPLRIDFVSALTMIDIAAINLAGATRPVYAATMVEDFSRILVAGDAERLPYDDGVRIQITGLDPQLILPPIETAPTDDPLRLQLRLKVHSEANVVA